ncbi:MAG: C1 family peptidase [Bacteroidales bacterium]|nr:C1 family peptidase [Bacteroidales bacterium]
MKKSLLIITALFSFGIVSAQQINESELEQVRQGFMGTTSDIALQNILTNDANIKNNAVNHSNIGKIDHYFKYRVGVKGITDQESSGRCWMFTSMNVLRPSVMEQFNLTNFDFSHNYCYFWDIFEKSNLFLENIIATADRAMDDRDVTFYFQSPVGDGGVWNLFYNIAEKYGVVPKSVMPETAHSNNTSQMVRIINERLRAGGYNLRESIAAGKKEKAIQNDKIVILKDIYRILALCLGEPPTEFAWRYKDKDGNIKTLKTTPLEFYKSIVEEDYNPSHYIMVMNDPTREYYKIYEIQNYRNTIEGINWVYLNLPNEEIKASALASIKNNEAMYVSCDVGKQSDYKSGILDVNNYDYESLLGVSLQMDKKARILTRQSGSSHAMTLIGCDTDENDVPTKWEFENSWGAGSGNGGYLTFTDEWFDEYLFRIVLHRNYLSEKAIQALDSEPIMLPAWDYMF